MLFSAEGASVCVADVSAEAAVSQAASQLQKAQQPFTNQDLRQQEQAVAQADAQLQKTLNPYTAQDLASAQAAVDSRRR